MTKKKSQGKVVGSGIKTSTDAVLLSCTLHCRVHGSSKLFEWHDQDIGPEDVEGIDTTGLIIAVAHSFILCPTLFFSATGEQKVGKDGPS